MHYFRSFLLIIAFLSAVTVLPALDAGVETWLTSPQFPGALEKKALEVARAEGVFERFFSGFYTLVAQPFFQWGVVAMGGLVSAMWLFFCCSVGRMGYEELERLALEPGRSRPAFSGKKFLGFFRSRAPRSYPVPKTGSAPTGAPTPRHSTGDRHRGSHREWSLRAAVFTKKP